MKICVLTHSVHPTGGGSTKYFYEISQMLNGNGNDITLVCTAKASDRDIKVNDVIPVTQIPVPIFGHILQTIFFGLFSFLKLMGRNFDIYCYESGYIGFWASLFKLFKRKPLIAFSMRYGLRMLLHNLKNEQKKINLGFLVYSIWEIVFFVNEWIDVHIADRVVVLNKEAKELWKDSGLSASKIDIIPYGIDLSKYYPQTNTKDISKEIGIKNTDKIILYLGHLEPMRNVDKLVQAFNLLIDKRPNKNHKLLIIGSGRSEQNIKGLVNELNLSENVIFVPHIHDEHLLNKFINLGDIMVIPYPPGSTALIGAACGLPIITVENKGDLLGTIDEKLLNEFIILKSNEPVLMAKTCNELLDDNDKRNLISKKEFSAIKNYSWSYISQKLIKYFEYIKDNQSFGRMF